MDDYNFQQQVRALKERVSEMSMRYSSSMSAEDSFSNQLRELKARVSSMQERLLTKEGPISTAQLTPCGDAFCVKPGYYDESSSRFSPPSGPLFWQLMNSLRTDMQSLDNRVASFEMSMSDLENKLDELDPNRFTPTSSTSGSDFSYPVHLGPNAPSPYSNDKQNALSELSSGPSLHVSASPTWPLQAGGAMNESLNHWPPPLSIDHETTLRTQRMCDNRDCRCNNTVSLDIARAQTPQQLHQDYSKTFQSLKNQIDAEPLLVDTTNITQVPTQNDNPTQANAQGRNKQAPRKALLSHFQNLEHILDCFCDVNGNVVSGAESKARNGLTLTKKEILQNSCELLAYFANKNLKEAIRSGDKDVQVREGSEAVRASVLPKFASVVEDHPAQNRPMEVVRKTHPTNCMYCRKYGIKQPRELGADQLLELEESNNSSQQGLRDAFSNAQLDEQVRGPLELEQTSNAPTHSNQFEGLAFRDREIARLDEQLRVSQERLRYSEQISNDAQNAILRLQREQDRLETISRVEASRNMDLEDQAVRNNNRLAAQDDIIDALRNQIVENNEALEAWERSWTQLHESSQRENAKVRDREQYIAEERERNKYEMERTIHEHRKDLTAIDNFCKQKDDVIYKQEQIISRGRKLLEERDREVALLQRDLRTMRDDKEHATRTVDRTARLLEERNAELSDLRRRLQANDGERTGSNAYRKEEQRSYTRNGKTIDTGDDRILATAPSGQDAQAMERSLLTPSNAYTERTDEPVQYRFSTNNPRPRRSRSSERRRNAPERNGRTSRHQFESKDDGPVRFVYGGRSGETVYRESSKVGTEQPSQGPPFDATFQPPLPAPVKIRRTESEANLRNTSRETNAIPARKNLSRYQSMHEMRGRLQLQPYVESDVESGGELGGEV